MPFTSPSSAFSPLIRTLFVRCARATKKRLARSRAADQAFAEQTIRGERAPPPTPRREPCRRADTVCSQNIQKTKIKPERDKPLIALLKKMPHSNVRSVVFPSDTDICTRSQNKIGIDIASALCKSETSALRSRRASSRMRQ